jgi:hypothetical protein
MRRHWRGLLSPLTGGAHPLRRKFAGDHCLGALLAFAALVVLKWIFGGIRMQVTISSVGIAVMVAAATANCASMRPRRFSRGDPAPSRKS